MSIHRSLKSRNAHARQRSVLTRGERLAALAEQEKWQEGETVFGLPKVKVARVRTKKKKEKKEEEGVAEGVAEGEAAAPEAEAPKEE